MEAAKGTGGNEQEFFPRARKIEAILTNRATSGGPMQSVFGNNAADAGVSTSEYQRAQEFADSGRDIIRTRRNPPRELGNPY